MVSFEDGGGWLGERREEANVKHRQRDSECARLPLGDGEQTQDELVEDSFSYLATAKAPDTIREMEISMLGENKTHMIQMAFCSIVQHNQPLLPVDDKLAKLKKA